MARPIIKHDPYAALRVRDFRLFIITRIVNNIGFQIVDVAVGWQIFSLTHDPLSLGLVGLSVALPTIAVLLYGGHLSDRKNRRTISLWMLNILTATTISLMFISMNIHSFYASYGTLPIYLTLFIAGTASGLLAPSVISFSYQLVPQELAPNA